MKYLIKNQYILMLYFSGILIGVLFFFYLYLQLAAEGETSHCSFSKLFKHFFCLFDTMSKVIGNNNIIQNQTHLYKSILVLRAKKLYLTLPYDRSLLPYIPYQAGIHNAFFLHSFGTVLFSSVHFVV